MSFPHRFGRIVRAYWGALRHGPAEEGFSFEDGAAEDYTERRYEQRGGRGEEPPPPPPGVPEGVAAAYRALEVPVGSERRAVKKSYRRLMQRYHQDRFENDPERRAIAREVSQRLNAAYECVNAHLDAQASGRGRTGESV